MTYFVWIVAAVQASQGSLAPLTLQDCIKTAFQNHARVQQAELDLASARAGVIGAKSGYLPFISANGSWQKRQDLLSDGSEVRSESKTGALSVTETVFDNGQTVAQVRRAKASQKLAEFGLKQSRNDLATDVATSYYRLLEARRARDVSRDSLRLAEEQLKEIDARIEAEVAAKADRYPLVARVADAKVNLTQAENEVRQAATALRNIMGLPLGPEPDVTDTEDPTLPKLEFESLLEYARMGRPEIGRALASVESSQASVWLAKLQVGPRLVVDGGYARILEPTPVGDDWRAQARVTLPLWDFGASRSRLSAAKADEESAKRGLEQTRKDVAAEVERAFLALTSSAEAYEASRANSEAAQVSLEAAQEKYKVGAAITLEVTDAQLRYFEALLKEARARYNYFRNYSLLQRAIGQEPGSTALPGQN